MERRKRSGWGRTRSPIKWDASDWQRGWNIAMRRIEQAPSIVAEREPFWHALDMLDRGFADGDFVQFGHGLVTLLDCCTEAIKRGDCKQWWD